MRDTKKSLETRYEGSIRDFGPRGIYTSMYRMMPVVFKDAPIRYEQIERICMGVTTDNVPFVAELWLDGEDERLTFVIPKLHIDEWDIEAFKRKYKDIELFKSEGYAIELKCCVTENISDDGDEEDMLVVTLYTEYLKRKGLITFLNDYEGVCLSYGKDMIGNEVAVITIDMVIDGVRYAETDVSVRVPSSLYV